MAVVLYTDLDLLAVGIESVTVYDRFQYRKGGYAGLYEIEYTDGVTQWGDDEKEYNKYLKMANLVPTQCAKKCWLCKHNTSGEVFNDGQADEYTIFGCTEKGEVKYAPKEYCAEFEDERDG